MERKSRKTRQKEWLGEEMKRMNSFFTAEELFEKSKRKDTKIGIATVYRFLSEGVEKRKIHAYTCNRKTIYSLDARNHCHFICEKCGKITHITINTLDFIKNKIKNHICHFQIDVHGYCDKCKEVNDQEEDKRIISRSSLKRGNI